MKENTNSNIQKMTGRENLQSINPVTQTVIPQKFVVATSDEINSAAENANEAWKTYRKTSGKEKASFLSDIVLELESLGDTLVHKAMEESGLPEGRIRGELGRTCNQLLQFADLLKEGDWVDAIIDEALPHREPLPRADIRKMSVALGPVAVFTASNFPLAFSTAGGDTASALAAGCPVLVKAHPSHLGTNHLVAGAIIQAAQKNNLPKGVFASLNGGVETGQQLVGHPLIKAVGFTGSYTGGKALFDLANRRTTPIPVYAEMGSNNPIFILNRKLSENAETLASTIANSVNLGAGQFCTNPGILVLEKGKEADGFITALKIAFEKLSADTMLNEGIYKAYNRGKASCFDISGVTPMFEHKSSNDDWKAGPSFASVPASKFMDNVDLQEEVFGPFTLIVVCEDKPEMLQVASHLRGQLTATIMGNAQDLANALELSEILAQKAGRVIFNGVPTGVEVCPAMHHGGPFPASSNALFTSVGMDAIKRFVRPVSFQDMPDDLLPEELKQDNPLKILRTVNGMKTRE
ncbi:aldehyde dehydrogenase (NADP(+)) [Flagellimonas allohymeniacidonis]|uniref:Aldehyde dehydrogenase (NADP(+)) n=1 Tax=Flagellimonas allohymeniacidonis TaxID=2517819 RepID=A0A4Q8QFP4_9FLAO|nr:aldehyde dehydrogenase (NADP(+)) [Allomuricauda hymeniacidonis]TAI48527.1 aldehyde dehydrogenase (NADP(+)) [Allomuricauda hymeniacidonis]